MSLARPRCAGIRGNPGIRPRGQQPADHRRQAKRDRPEAADDGRAVAGHQHDAVARPRASRKRGIQAPEATEDNELIRRRLQANAAPSRPPRPEIHQQDQQHGAKRPTEPECFARQEPMQPKPIDTEAAHQDKAGSGLVQPSADRHAQRHHDQAGDDRQDPLAPVERCGEPRPGIRPLPDARQFERQDRGRQQRANGHRQACQRRRGPSVNKPQCRADQGKRDQRRQAGQKRLRA